MRMEGGYGGDMRGDWDGEDGEGDGGVEKGESGDNEGIWGDGRVGRVK